MVFSFFLFSITNTLIVKFYGEESEVASSVSHLDPQAAVYVHYLMWIDCVYVPVSGPGFSGYFMKFDQNWSILTVLNQSLFTSYICCLFR